VFRFNPESDCASIASTHVPFCVCVTIEIRTIPRVAEPPKLGIQGSYRRKDRSLGSNKSFLHHCYRVFDGSSGIEIPI
jgi:hypothetical protein